MIATIEFNKMQVFI